MQTSDLDLTGVLDEAYERLHRTGPEFDGYVSAALTAAYAPLQPWSGPLAKPADSPEKAGRLALENGDVHIIKFTETALRAERRGLADGRAAAAHALRIIPLDQ